MSRVGANFGQLFQHVLYFLQSLHASCVFVEKLALVVDFSTVTFFRSIDARVCFLFLDDDLLPFVSFASSLAAADLEVEANTASRKTASLCSRTSASFAQFSNCLSIFLFLASSLSLSLTFFIACFANCSPKSDPKSIKVSSLKELFSINDVLWLIGFPSSSQGMMGSWNGQTSKSLL